MTPLGQLLDLVAVATSHLGAIREQGRAWAADDLLTRGEALARLRAGRENREAKMLLDRTELRHAPGDARWRWGDVLDATRAAVLDATSAPPIPMADLTRRTRQARPG